MSFDELVKIAQAGGNMALLVSVFYMLKITDRLARIDTRLKMLLHREGIKEVDYGKDD